MDDSGLMRRIHTRENLREPRRGCLTIDLAHPLELRAQRRAAHQLHHQVSSLGSDAAIVKERDDIGMTQACGGLRLTLEAAEGSPIAEHAAEHDLDRDFA